MVTSTRTMQRDIGIYTVNTLRSKASRDWLLSAVVARWRISPIGRLKALCHQQIIMKQPPRQIASVGIVTAHRNSRQDEHCLDHCLFEL
jgi:hypothetical protein